MKLTTTEGLALRRALIELGRNRARHFDDLLWLNFGDRCQAIMNALVHAGCVQLPDPSCWFTATLTPQGHALVTQLSARLSTRASSETDAASTPAAAR